MRCINFIEESTCGNEKIAALKEMNVGRFQIYFSRSVLNVGQNIKAYK